MALMGEYKYHVENNISLNDKLLDSLVLLYQPLIGAQALSLYISLNKLNIHTNYSNLSKLSGLSSECIERALIMLERYRLVKTYKKNDENEYIHQLNIPLLPNDFLGHYVYGLELRKQLGNFQYNHLVEQFRNIYIDKSDYLDISEVKIFNLNQFDEQDLADLLKNKDNNVIMSSKFNFELFFSDVSELKFPSILRTQENLNLIAELALFYGISETRMAILVYRSIDYANTEFLTNKLIQRARLEKVEVDESINKYDLPNIAFLQQIQNGAAVSELNKKLLEELAFQMLLSKQVINRLVEFVLETNKYGLVRNYVLQIASVWKTYDVKTVEQANQLIKQINFSNNKSSMPKEVRRVEVSSVNEKLNDDEIENIQKQWERLGELYGASED